MPSKTPAPKEHYNDMEVRKAVNNATIAQLRWERTGGVTKGRAQQLAAFTLSLVDTLQEDVLIDPDTKVAVMNPGELALCLQTACLFVIFRHVIPNGMALQRTFVEAMTGEPA